MGELCDMGNALHVNNPDLSVIRSGLWVWMQSAETGDERTDGLGAQFVDQPDSL